MGSLYSPGKGSWDKPIHEHVNELDFLNVLSCEFDKLLRLGLADFRLFYWIRKPSDGTWSYFFHPCSASSSL
ncbi:Uncharacterized protein HZ326_1221 [Fusarium oxysporum f. sp. albedinis]|nr:Uncharacterized protein HZ326_1221 [Fusarium oxysporum f. sp. albedinis]